MWGEGKESIHLIVMVRGLGLGLVLFLHNRLSWLMAGCIRIWLDDFQNQALGLGLALD